ncbi:MULTISPECIES: ABC transporter ATP-binding protein [Rhizobium/Agrobacterium group]|uniref:ABC transporter of agropinic acid, nucleotide binding/ATPase protein n=1 Tax=Agrobacterium tumefaciens TaxID=358 RepID=K7WT15_AGRTU|nr:MULTISPECIES: ABC transporter ATP-binding protein [Rhizobium/Agrobacterium group]AFX65612.1 ABC transporter of agropinic acid, nucleotide binding/ATPase protein [Agrobacterium radiobacter]KEA03002.1 ABC transporter ATPase [Rhizobium rhizogenes]NTI39003.1 ABC transporter ATP-binding protein [Rhizobium rhizogenes]NTI85187.1 ABC transporter ATP-binding protein [Rhizobium rhizogenes]NTJ27373.1 ABC transporter ATP-binding protein [Rhizobium rhizogenes]
MPGREILRIDNLSIAFRTDGGLRAVVNGVSLTLTSGEILGLVGESGSGKTILSLAAMGLLPHNATVTSGRVEFAGENLLTARPDVLRKLRGKRISMIFQDPMASLDPVFTCGSQIVEAIQLHERITRRQAGERARDLLAKVGIADPARCMRSYPHELSGGQCQRIMIAMAVACKPDVIIADEPTTALDVTVQKQVLTLLRDLNREIGAAILLITHDLGVIYEVADRVAVIYRGDLMEQASTGDLFRAPRSAYTKALIASMPSASTPQSRLPVICRDDLGQISSVVEVRPSQKERLSKKPEGETLLEIRNLTKTYWLRETALSAPKPFRAVDDVSLVIPARSTVGLVGESGCGKSTLSRLVMRLMQPDSGAIEFEGRDLVSLDHDRLRAARRDFALVFQNPYGSLNPRQTVTDLIAAPIDIHQRGRDREAAVARLLDAVGLPRDAMGRYPHEFSGGQRQRIVIARALALNPKLLICDEAVSALDVSVQAQVLNLLQDLQDEFDLTYLFISHDMSVVRHVSDTIAVMQKGKIVEIGPAAEVFDNPKEDYTRTLLSAVPKIGTGRPAALEAH